MDWTQLPVFFAAALALTIAPGPDIVYVVTRGAAQGKKVALAAAVGFGLGNLFHTLLAVAGLSAIIAASATAFAIVKYAGAIYLAWIGVMMWRDKSSFETSADAEKKSARLVFRQSILANMLNPKVVVFFLAFIPQFVNSDSAPALQFLILGLLFTLQACVVFSIVAVLSGSLGDLLRTNRKLGNGLRYLAGAVLIGLALKLAFIK